MKDQDRPLLITYENQHLKISKDASIQAFWKSAFYLGYRTYQLGLFEDWKGFGNKLVSLRRVLPKVIKHNPKQIIIVTDARDVIVNRTESRLVSTFHKVRGRHRIVLSTEIGCCVYPMWQYKPGSFISAKGKRLKRAEIDGEDITEDYIDEWREVMKSRRKTRDSDFNALNAGMLMGYAKDILRMIEIMDPKLTEDDQALWSECMYRYPNMITLDYDNMIFSNSNSWTGAYGCHFKFDKRRGRWYNTRTKTFPYFIQTPGAIQDNFKCYRKLSKVVPKRSSVTKLIKSHLLKTHNH